MKNFYLKKYGYFKELIEENPQIDLEIIIVIPCYNESDLISTLKSLRECERPNGSVEIIIIINAPINAHESIKNRNELTYQEALNFISKENKHRFSFYVFNLEFPPKDSGVGLARKVGMDEAVRRFEIVQNHKGIIVCLDADCKLEKSYLIEIEKHFTINSKTPGASIYFEHDLRGNGQKLDNGIVLYELFLRYYVNALRFSEHPFSFQTIGSSMAVRSTAYQAQGGMNKRKAGEDFYFLQKIIALGNYSEINSTKVIPSARVSNRVPFGTGKAMGDWINGKSIMFYDFRIFEALKLFLASIEHLYSLNEIEDYLRILPLCIQSFLIKNDFEKIQKEIKKNTSTLENFKKRFFNWFNGFMVLKYVHWATERHFTRVEALSAVNPLLYHINNKSIFHLEKDALLFFREHDLSRT